MLNSIIIILAIAAGSWILLGILAALTYKLPIQIQLAVGAGSGMGLGFLLTCGGLPGLVGTISGAAVIINCVIGFLCFRNKTMIGMAVGLLIPILIKWI